MNDDFFDFATMREDFDLEFKTAAGKDGSGALPKSFWQTYSAMANTEGGYIILGVEEKGDELFVRGIKNPNKVFSDLWNILNNRLKVSCNLLHNDNVRIFEQRGVKLIEVHIPQAGRKHRPVYIDGNPLRGTYRRNKDGDYRCTEELVKQMLAEQGNDTRDSILLEGFGFNDLNLETLQIYRRNFINRKPQHPFNDCDDQEFLRQLGGWTCDRQTGKEGLTVAGLLMFGNLRSILDAIPNYILDYQERPRAVTESRWIDRVTIDFSWSGNLYDFYRVVIQKLYEGLKVPFKLSGDKRIEDTPVHEALREALVNTLIHADYAGSCSILIVKRPDLFGFRNPGMLRVPREDAIRGGLSDCRNRNLQKMFQLIGLGEQAGSGMPKIYKNWSSQHWKQPELEERLESNQTVLAMRMTSLLPKDIVEEFQQRMGLVFKQLSKLERIALVTAKAEGCVSHRRLIELSNEHPRELSEALHHLVQKRLLNSEGGGRSTFYYIPGEHPIYAGRGLSVEGMFLDEPEGFPVLSGFCDETNEHTGPNSEHKDPSSEHTGPSSEHKQPSAAEHPQLLEIAKEIAVTRRSSPALMRETILNLCLLQELSIHELARLLKRGEDTLRVHYVNRMCEEGVLVRKYPNILNHPFQKYRAAKQRGAEGQVK